MCCTEAALSCQGGTERAELGTATTVMWTFRSYFAPRNGYLELNRGLYTRGLQLQLSAAVSSQRPIQRRAVKRKQGTGVGMS